MKLFSKRRGSDLEMELVRNDHLFKDVYLKWRVICGVHFSHAFQLVNKEATRNKYKRLVEELQSFFNLLVDITYAYKQTII
mmetsp:Transcript_29441/g.21898  ORF Transcript_29441/g.21898 Transcript_29441/m.21898 type:complete len:81 (-) Transcript_29441:582-824(-)